MIKKAISIGTLAAITFGAAGCATSVSPPPEAMETEIQFADEYIIGIGDSLAVDVWRNPDLSVNAPVRPDGKITVPVIGDFHAGGLTPEDAAEAIKVKLQDYVRDPIVTVSVVNMGGADYLTRVRVTGAIRSAQSMQYRHGMTVLDVVLDAGGATEFANTAKTVLFRQGGEKLQVRLDRILKGDLSTNYPVKPGDVITVPERAF